MKYAIVPSERTDFVELAQTKEGRLFKKEILRVGKFSHPSGKADEVLEITPELLATLKKNFDDGVCDIVQIPVVGDTNAHTEDPERNAGEVIGMQVEGDKLFATLDIRKDAVADQLGKTLIGASVMYHQNYENTATRQKVGATPLHVAITNRPHITGLEPFQELVAASGDSSDDVVAFTPQVKPKEEPPKMPKTIAEWAAELKVEHPGIDLEALIAASKAEPESDKILASLAAALDKAGLVKLTNTDPGKPPVGEDLKNVVETVTKLSTDNTALSSRVQTLEDERITSKVDEKVRTGFIIPAKRDKMVELAKRDFEAYELALPDEPIVKLTSEQGVSEVENDDQKVEDVDKEITRLSAMANGKAS
jgi:hypothetical protein